MKMAKASEADLEMAMELCAALDALTSSWPSLPAALCEEGNDLGESFYSDDDRQCGIVLRYMLGVAERASLQRVVYGCAVMLDPRNSLVDPSADTIERHPQCRCFTVQQTAPVPPIVTDVLAELDKAVAKFPTWPTDPLHALAVLGEEFGELTKDVLQLCYEPHKTTPESARKEAMQTAAMALRFAISLGRYEYRPGQQHAQGEA